jgi:hypothetical protein
VLDCGQRMMESSAAANPFRALLAVFLFDFEIMRMVLCLVLYHVCMARLKFLLSVSLLLSPFRFCMMHSRSFVFESRSPHLSFVSCVMFPIPFCLTSSLDLTSQPHLFLLSHPSPVPSRPPVASFDIDVIDKVIHVLTDCVDRLGDKCVPLFRSPTAPS